MLFLVSLNSVNEYTTGIGNDVTFKVLLSSEETGKGGLGIVDDVNCVLLTSHVETTYLFTWFAYLLGS